jgi:hypothetical protein
VFRRIPLGILELVEDAVVIERIVAECPPTATLISSAPLRSGG